VHSTPLADAASQLDEDRRNALEREVVDGWQPFTEEGRMALRVGGTVATGRKP
jgi:hypothetical protein